MNLFLIIYSYTREKREEDKIERKIIIYIKEIEIKIGGWFVIMLKWVRKAVKSEDFLIVLRCEKT